MPVKTPIGWFGGKGNFLGKLLPLIPPHHTYVEPFGGAAALLFAKPSAPVEIYNDIDSRLVNLYRVLRDEKQFQRFKRMAELTPYSREEYFDCRERAECGDDDVMRAWRFWVVARMSFGGLWGHSWGMNVTKSDRGRASSCNSYLQSIDKLLEFHGRIMAVQIENRDYAKIFELYDTEKTLFYCDPPYVHETRSHKRYEYEMTHNDYIKMINILLCIKGMIILSGYRHDVYRPLEDAGWRVKTWLTACAAVGRTRHTGWLGENALRQAQPREECVWISPNAIVQGDLFNEVNSAE